MISTSVSTGPAEVQRLELDPVIQYAWARRLLTVVLYGAVLATCSVVAYWIINGAWSGFDDEGFFDYSLKTFVAGHPLYSSVYSEYGPFYYVAFGALFKLTGLAVTMEAGRWITLGIWMITCLGFGVTAQLYTKSMWMGLATLLGTFMVLTNLANGPMHAQTMVVLLTMAIAAVVMLGLPRFARAAPFALGALLAALLLTKINLGGFAYVAVGFAAVMAGPSWLRRRWMLTIAAAGFVLLGPALMHSEWHIQEQVRYSLAISLSSLALTVVAWPRADDGAEVGAHRELVRWVVTGSAVCGGLVMLIVVVLGSNLNDLIQQTIVTPSHQADFLQISLTDSTRDVELGVLGLAVAVLTRWRPSRSWLPVSLRRAASLGQLLGGVARLVVGVAVIMPASALPPFRGLGYSYVYAWPAVWLIALPLRGDLRRWDRLPRVMLASIAISQSLMAYPVAGAQVGLGGLTFVLCGALCVTDGAYALRRSGELRRYGRQAGITVGVVVALLLAAGTFYENLGKNFSEIHNNYRSGAKLQVIGAAGVLLPPATAAAINGLVAKVHSVGCRSLMEIPGQYSFNLWTGLDTPDPLTGQQPYWASLSSTEQGQVLRAARASRDLCLINAPNGVGFYTAGAPLPRSPLINYLEDDFRSVGTYGDSELEVRKRGR
jgi:hypothetical protein